MSTFEEQIQMLTKANTEQIQTPSVLKPEMFSMPQNKEDDFGMPKLGGFLKVSNGNTAVITIGVVLSSTVGGYVSSMLPSHGQYASVIAGALIMYLGKKNNMLKDFGVGVLIGGLAQVFSGLGSMIPGMSMPKDEVREDKITYGGSDGMYPTQPERRVFS